jgi:hypothetical protein
VSNRHASWLLPALSIIVTMVVTGGVLLYLNPDRASALDDVVPTGGSLEVAAAESGVDCAFDCRSGSGVCGSSLECAGGPCSVEDCLKACDEAGVACSEECIAACTNGACTGGSCTVEDCVEACNKAGVECSPERIAACIANRDCSGGGACVTDGKGGCAPVVASPRGGGCCSK